MHDKPLNKYLDDNVMFVIGYIDGYGAIHARTTEGSEMHTEAERLAGRPFRWNVPQQKFAAVLGCSRLDEDDRIAVINWLTNNEYYFDPSLDDEA
jgi:hypothetical protein